MSIGSAAGLPYDTPEGDDDAHVLAWWEDLCAFVESCAPGPRLDVFALAREEAAAECERNIPAHVLARPFFTPGQLDQDTLRECARRIRAMGRST